MSQEFIKNYKNHSGIVNILPPTPKRTEKKRQNSSKQVTLTIKFIPVIRIIQITLRVEEGL